jgi:3-hydroxyisobutyrate dehydrogenase-like beta-hydroxyacid dehydrogenase
MVDVVITSLTGADALRATFGGPTGALARARGQSFVEMSTAGPDVLEELAPSSRRPARRWLRCLGGRGLASAAEGGDERVTTLFVRDVPDRVADDP